MKVQATAVIKRDHLDGSYDGKVLQWDGGADESCEGLVRDRFQLIDDDGELYYSGTLMHHNDLGAWDQLWEWGAADSGTTLLRINGEDVIG